MSADLAAAEDERARRARLVFLIALVLLACVPVYTVFFLAIGVGFRLPTLAVLAAGLLVVPVLLRVRRSRHVTRHGNWVVTLLVLVLTSVSFTSGGTASSTMLWYPTVPLLALLMAGRRSALGWSAVTAVHLGGFYVLGLAGRLPPSLIPPGPVHLGFLLLGQVSLTAVLLGVGVAFESVKNRAIARARADALRLGASEARFRALIEQLPDALAVSRDGQLVFANPALVTFLGRPEAGALLGRPLNGFVHPGDRGRLGGPHDAAGRASRCEVRFVAADGTDRVGDVARLSLDFDGRDAELAVVRDVTEHKRLRAQLAQMDRLAAMGTLAAGVAHEINNPLTYVLANVEHATETLLALREARRDGPQVDLGLVPGAGPRPPPDARGLDDALAVLRDAQEGSERIRQIVQDLKSFSRLEELSAEARGTADLRRVLEFSAKLVKVELRHRARLELDLAEVPPVQGDEGRLSQVFVNLLVNAGHAIRQGAAAENAITVRLFVEGERVVVEVRDTGCGIPPQHLPRLFDPFFTTKPAGVGTGLGLPVSRDIVESLGGEIRVESEPGRGSCFTVALPAAEPPRLSDPPLPQRSAGRRGRVLIVDDEPAVLQVASRALGASHEVVVADCASAALAQLGTGTAFDVILCDVTMPDLTGVELLERLSADQARRVVFISGGAWGERTGALLERLENPLLAKPFDVAQLRAVVGALVGDRAA